MSKKPKGASIDFKKTLMPRIRQQQISVSLSNWASLKIQSFKQNEARTKSVDAAYVDL